jgi:hypothetical protein
MLANLLKYSLFVVGIIFVAIALCVAVWALAGWFPDKQAFWYGLCWAALFFFVFCLSIGWYEVVRPRFLLVAVFIGFWLVAALLKNTAIVPLVFMVGMLFRGRLRNWWLRRKLERISRRSVEMMQRVEVPARVESRQ